VPRLDVADLAGAMREMTGGSDERQLVTVPFGVMGWVGRFEGVHFGYCLRCQTGQRRQVTVESRDAIRKRQPMGQFMQDNPEQIRKPIPDPIHVQRCSETRTTPSTTLVELMG
jgi:hypothetical protein